MNIKKGTTSQGHTILQSRSTGERWSIKCSCGRCWIGQRWMIEDDWLCHLPDDPPAAPSLQVAIQNGIHYAIREDGFARYLTAKERHNYWFGGGDEYDYLDPDPQSPPGTMLS